MTWQQSQSALLPPTSPTALGGRRRPGSGCFRASHATNRSRCPLYPSTKSIRSPPTKNGTGHGLVVCTRNSSSARPWPPCVTFQQKILRPARPESISMSSNAGLALPSYWLITGIRQRRTPARGERFVARAISLWARQRSPIRPSRRASSGKSRLGVGCPAPCVCVTGSHGSAAILACTGSNRHIRPFNRSRIRGISA